MRINVDVHGGPEGRGPEACGRAARPPGSREDVEGPDPRAAREPSGRFARRRGRRGFDARIARMIVAVVLLAGAFGCRREKRGDGPGGRVMKVTTAPVEERLFRETVRVQGTVESEERATLSALVGGTIEALLVEEGDRVRNAQPLFQTDKLNLENQVQIAKHNVEVARASEAEANAAVREAEATYQKAEADVRRFRKLYEADKAVTLDAFERMDTAFKRADAGLAHARALVALSVARGAQAESSLRIAEKQMADSLVRAPFDGVVTRRLHEPGEYAAPGAAVLALENPARLEIALVLSSDYYDRVLPERTRLRFRRAGREEEAPVHFKAPSVHPVTRTFEVKARLPSAEGFSPGMLCDVDVILAEHRGLGVPDGAVGRRGGRAVVFKAEEGRAVARPVEPGACDDGFTELLDAADLAGVPIVVDGQTFLNDRDPIRTD